MDVKVSGKNYTIEFTDQGIDIVNYWEKSLYMRSRPSELISKETGKDVIVSIPKEVIVEVYNKYIKEVSHGEDPDKDKDQE